MKIGWNLSNSLLRSEIFNRANKSFGTSIGLSFWRRLRLLIGFVLCSVGALLASAGLSKPITGTVRHLMKTKTGILAILLAASLANSQAQDTWTQKADFGGGPRDTRSRIFHRQQRVYWYGLHWHQLYE